MLIKIAFGIVLICGVTAASDSYDNNKLNNNEGVHWALIVAGSNGWYNYRHQADACHAYHIMKKHGIPAERIITMMYDDIAYNSENPTPGIIINHPNGSDVYGGVIIDYKGKDVTPEMFLSVLSGRKDLVNGRGNGKVINSGPNDHIFVNFVDHGAPGILAFPDGELRVRDLIQTINSMYNSKKYAQLVFYVEACESGSMFYKQLPPNVNVYATTAANEKESSYACYYDAERRTYLGDLYSVNWMEDSDKENLKTESLHQQFMIVKEETNTSHVQEYGDMNIAKEPVGDFQGGEQYVQPKLEYNSKPTFDAVPSELVPLAILMRSLQTAQTDAERQQIHDKINKLLEMHNTVNELMKSIVSWAVNDQKLRNKIFAVHHHLINLDCYEPTVKYFDQHCIDISQNDYVLRKLYMLVNLCEEGVDRQVIIDAIDVNCKN